MKQFWDERFSGEQYVYGEQPNVFFKRELLKVQPGQLLLPGEGEGRNAVWAAQQGWAVQAVDLSDSGKKKALNLARRSGVAIQYAVADLSDFDFGKEQFSFIAVIFVHLPPLVRKHVHQQLVQALKPDGLLLVEAFHKNQVKFDSGGPRDESLLYDSAMLINDFEELRLLCMKEETDYLDEGDWHKGEASVVRMIAQKNSSKFIFAG